MKIIKLAVGTFFNWMGYERITSENPSFSGWILVVIGTVTILSALFSFSGRSSRFGNGSSGDSYGWDEGSGWGDSGDGD